MDGKLIIHVAVDFKVSRNGKAELELPFDWAGEGHLEHSVTNLKALSPDTVIADITHPGIKTFSFSASRTVTVAYRVRQALNWLMGCATTWIFRGDLRLDRNRRAIATSE